MDVRTSRSSAGMYEIFPFLLIPVLIYNLLALFSAPSVAGSAEPSLLATLRAERSSCRCSRARPSRWAGAIC